MRSHPEAKWSEVARRAMAECPRRLEGVVSAEELIKELGEELAKDLDSISLKRAEEHFRQVREAERRLEALSYGLIQQLQHQQHALQ
ncbi:MAG: hypothetical protein DRJ56_07625 [Thermoprotei archaeon]|nr:MAG: hypothetical protein DRJ56_07625 [Thermoprotei archaeon]